MTEKAKSVGDNGASWRTGGRHATAALFGVDSTVALRSANTRRASKSPNPSFNRTPREDVTTTPSSSDLSDHSHRWRIDEPNGPVSTGVCKKCGTTKEFRNWLQEIDFITGKGKFLNRRP